MPTKTFAEIEGGACQFGRCKCKTQMGYRCKKCASPGSDFCYLHVGCADPATGMLMGDMGMGSEWYPPMALPTMGMGSEWYPPMALPTMGMGVSTSRAEEWDAMERMKIEERARMYASQLTNADISGLVPSLSRVTSAPLATAAAAAAAPVAAASSAASTAASMASSAAAAVASPLVAATNAAMSTLGAATAAGSAALSSVMDTFAFGVPPIADVVETVTRAVSPKSRFFGMGGACETLVKRVYHKPAYTLREAERIYDLDKRLSAYSLSDVLGCLKKSGKINAAWLTRGPTVDTSGASGFLDSLLGVSIAPGVDARTDEERWRATFDARKDERENVLVQTIKRLAGLFRTAKGTERSAYDDQLNAATSSLESYYSDNSLTEGEIKQRARMMGIGQYF